MSYIIADTCDIYSLICKITLHELYLNDYTMKLFQLSFRQEQVIGILGTSVTVNYRPQRSKTNQEKLFKIINRGMIALYIKLYLYFPSQRSLIYCKNYRKIPASIPSTQIFITHTVRLGTFV